MRKTYTPHITNTAYPRVHPRAPPLHTMREPHAPPNPRPYSYCRPNIPPNHRFDRPPGPTAPPYRPNFVVELFSNHRSSQKPNIDSLIAQCKLSPDNFNACPPGSADGALCFREWTGTLQAMVNLWESRFDGAHNFEPRLKAFVHVLSDEYELRDRIRALFMDRVSRLKGGEEVNKWREKRQRLVNETKSVSVMLGRPNQPAVCEKLCEKRKGQIAETELISKRLMEFTDAMNCVMDHLEGKVEENSGEEGVTVFKFGEAFNWNRIYSFISRECRRLEVGLPIYAFRKEILHQIRLQPR